MDTKKDFEAIVSKKALGWSWQMIASHLNEGREGAPISVNRAVKLYRDTLRKQSKTTDPEIQEIEQYRILDELDWVLESALQAYKSSKTSGLSVKERRGYTPKSIDPMAPAVFTKTPLQKQFEVIRSEINEAGDPKWLEIVLKVLERKAKLLGLEAAKNKDTDLATLFSNVIIVDDTPRAVKSLNSSEEEALQFEDIAIELEIDDEQQD